ncbi:carbohydrate ABC transporter permease [Rathayibacter festucae]|uniref:carbohydrate ABC transporter permease n=1 Tax=Rathayibacter festucae TaxID=110937 RepID=UPI002A6A6D78|nr:carbohydrate ABC transporter permease [Rathayibacter festucae]
MTSTPAVVRSKSSRASRRAGRVVVYLLLAAVGIGCVVPFVWLLRSSLMTTAQIFSSPPEWIPAPIEWGNFAGALEAQPFVRYFFNTLLIVCLVVPGVLLSTSAAAFSFARLQWRGKKIVFGAVMSSLLLPWAVTLVPTYIMWQNLGLVGTYAPLTVPAFFAAGAGFNIFLLRQFFQQIPLELDNAVYVDGGTPWTVYTRVMLPLNKGPLTLVAIFTVIATWNDLLGPLIYITDPDTYTMSQGLAAFRGLYVSQWGYLMAASLLVILPIIVLFAFAQRYIMEGVALTGLK